MSQVLTLPDGNVEITMTLRGATTLAGVSKVLPRTCGRPGSPGASPNGGSFTGSLDVFATPSAGRRSGTVSGRADGRTGCRGPVPAS